MGLAIGFWPSGLHRRGQGRKSPERVQNYPDVGPFCGLGCSKRYRAAAEVALRLKKHSRQKTGRPCVGLKGTVVSRPHCEQLVMVSVLA